MYMYTYLPRDGRLAAQCLPVGTGPGDAYASRFHVSTYCNYSISRVTSPSSWISIFFNCGGTRNKTKSSLHNLYQVYLFTYV